MTDWTTVAGVLNGAADILDADGVWTKGALGRDADGKVLFDFDDVAAAGDCAQLDLEAALWITSEGNDPLRSLATDEVREHLGVPFLFEWQDHPDRTKDDVVNALRGAAERAGRRAAAATPHAGGSLR